MTVATDLDELERLARRATPGPWSTYSSGSSRDYRPGVGARDSIVAAEVWDTDEYDNADYIAAVSPEVVLGLIKSLKSANARTEPLREGNKRTEKFLRMEREAARANLARAENAEARLADFVRAGVCLLCGDGVLESGDHIDPDRHTAVVEWVTSGRPELGDAGLDRPTRAQIAKALMRAAAEQGPRQDGELDLTSFVDAVWGLLDGEPA